MVEPIACALEQSQLDHRMPGRRDLGWSETEPTQAGELPAQYKQMIIIFS